MTVFNQLCRGISDFSGRNILRAGVSATALAACALPSIAWAQTASESDTATADDQNVDYNAIIVTGIRASLQSARTRKRDAEVVVDSISAQDIGALPDRSVSEALQRVPGVTLQRTSEARDPARLSGEGGGVFIRGLSFVRSELNGRDVFSANNGNSLSFEDISADLLSGVDVYKNPSADMIEGGIGGTINLRTRKPFDAPGFVAAVSGDINYADLRKKSFMSGSALVSDRWDTGLGEIGILASYSISNIGNRTDSISADRFLQRTLASDIDGHSAGDTVYVPNSVGFRRIDWQQERRAFDASIQWRPSSTLEFTAEALISKATPNDSEYYIGNSSQLTPEDPSFVYGDAGQLISGTANNQQPMLDTRAGRQRKKNQDYSFNARWEPDSHLTITGDVQYSKSTSKVYSMTAFTGMDVPATFDFNLSGDTPYLDMRPTDPAQSFADKSLNWWAAAMDHLEDNEADQWAIRGDIEYTFDDGFLKSLKVGGRWADRNAVTRQTTYNWGILSAQYWAQDDKVYLDQTGRAGGIQNPGLPNQSVYVPFHNFFRGEANSPTSGLWLPAPGLVNKTTGHAYDFLQATTLSWGWQPLSDDFSETTSKGGINNQGQETFSAYAVARFGMENSPFGRFDGNVGVRVVHTKLDALGSAINVGTISTNCTTADCTDFDRASNFAGGDLGNTLTAGSNSYTDVLPSLNLRYFATDDFQIRFAASKGISRPTFAQLNPYTSLNFSFDDTGAPNGTGIGGRTTAFTGTAGNPDLKPTRSNNYDLSFEYYYGRSNSLTLALFYKEISNYIFVGLEQQSYTSGGETITFDVNRQTNGAKGKIKGFELAYTQFFDFLPGDLSGLGLTANLTYVNSTGGQNSSVNVFDTATGDNAGLNLPLEGLSKWSYNVAGVYEKHGISARVAYNWRSHYLLTTSAANINYPVWNDDYGQLDASILVDVGDHMKIGLQGTNLLTSRTYLRVGDPSLKPRYSWTETDRRVAMVVRTRF
ncbi:TonB-dependent receptor [Novosphingobium beihaiensis]|uniref:TonB-dependent receptor n=1 Tax=Novosphingobium beihaiensis TaxID=2930389 RepID=A0ABT0BQR4_9SPHN|nr:TonB-dependent receptor [Novosphingobium beihaiensis]MCJ2187203.1 TonB-dependent receptor [Novosphingobium beihaiensis]